jgi:hypothetical protein
VSDPNDELARLAQQGQARLAEAQHDHAFAADAAAERNIRTAIGGVRGAPVRRLLIVLCVLCSAGTIVGFAVSMSAGPFVMMHYMPAWMAGIFGSVGLLMLALFLPPLASRAAVDAERAWVASLPFALEHYFTVIGAGPAPECCLNVELEISRELAPGLVQGVIANYDPESRVLEASGTRIHFRTGPISGSTGIRINRSNVYRNHRLGKAVHRLVDVVLLPIHRSAPLARVKLSRGYG